MGGSGSWPAGGSSTSRSSAPNLRMMMLPSNMPSQLDMSSIQPPPDVPPSAPNANAGEQAELISARCSA